MIDPLRPLALPLPRPYAQARAFPFRGLSAHRPSCRASGSCSGVEPPIHMLYAKTNTVLAPGIREYNTLLSICAIYRVVGM